MSACTYVANGEPCRFPGTKSDGLKGDGRWRCAYHDRCDDQATGERIVEASKRWFAMPNRIDAWHTKRRAEVYSSESPWVLKLRDEIAAHRASRSSTREKAAA
ncbi:MAG TPA: hypothetical protein PK694_01340 [Rhodospirillales bacterium]|nr:hypothetical protein [Rhodospirillales bacterium]